MWASLLFVGVLAHYEMPAKSPPKTVAGCPRCGTSLSGKKSCCGENGAWFGNCGLPGDLDFDHTWNEGIQSCPQTAVVPPSRSNNCPECRILKKTGKLSCCAPGGAWFNNCGKVGDWKFDHTWPEGIQACKKTPTAIGTVPNNPSSACPKCGMAKKTGKLSCCAPGGAWFNQCGNAGDSKFGHTWVEGIQACKKVPMPIAPIPKNPSNTCSKCGMNKAGRRSCCSRGGAWFNNCGDAGDENFGHTWVEGIEMCQQSTEKNSNKCSQCGILVKSGQLSCCGVGGDWFNNCGAAGNSKFDHTWFQGIAACKNVRA